MPWWNPFASDFEANAPTVDFRATGDYSGAIRHAQSAALAGPVQANRTASQQQQLAAALQAQMRGEGPSLAQQQLQQATDANARMAAGAMASQRGMNPALAQRLVLNQQAQANQQAAGQSAMIRSAEQMQAQQQLAAALQAQRAQDIGQQQANTQLYGVAGGLQHGVDALNQQTAAQNAQLNLGAQQINAQTHAQNAQNHAQLGGALLGAAGSAGAAIATGMADGGPVPGRAPVPGDHPANDVVPALLSPGEIVLPRSVAQADDAPDRAAEFVEEIKRRKVPRKTTAGYGEVLARLRAIEQRVSALGGGR